MEYEKILDLMEIRYAQQGKKITVSMDYFLDIYEVYKDSLKIFVAKLDGEIVTGTIDFPIPGYSLQPGLGIPNRGTAYLLSPNDLLIWESLRYAYEKGFRYYVTMNAARR